MEVEEVEDAEFSSSDDDEDEIDGWDLEELEKADKIPYPSVYEWLKQDDAKHVYFIPSKPVTATIVKATRDETGVHLFSSYVYQIQLEHGTYKWEVFKRFSDFNHLHNSLLLFRASERVKEPVRKLEKAIADAVDGEPEENVNLSEIKRVESSAPEDQIGVDETDTAVKLHAYYNSSASQTGSQEQKPGRRKKREIPVLTLQHDDCYAGQQGHSRLIRLLSVNNPANGEAVEQPIRAAITATTDHSPAAEVDMGKLPKPQKKRKKKFPHLPRTIEAMINSEEELEGRKEALQDYLQQVLDIWKYRNHPETVEFLEISRLSFVHNLGGKYNEGLLKKRPGGRKKFFGVVRFCIECCARWGKRWLVIKDSFIVYLHPGTEVIRCVMLFDGDFAIKTDPAQNEGTKHVMVITNKQRELMLKCKSDRRMNAWRDALMTAVTTAGKIWIQDHRFNSFAPERESVYAQWYVDGKSYMEEVANMLEAAKEEIFITDWWLSPQIYMKRPALSGTTWRLDEILKRKAKSGVKVYVLLYKEVAMALGINSQYSKQWLMALHPNIKVLRHPDHQLLASSSIMLWAHHEKLVVVDQNVAFVGGIDLCYGRWDDHTHKLTDLGSIAMAVAAKCQPNYSLSHGIRGMAPILSGFSVLDSVVKDERTLEKETCDTSKQPPTADTGETHPIDDSPPLVKSSEEVGVDETDKSPRPSSSTVSPPSSRFKTAAKAFKSLSVTSSGPPTGRSFSEIVELGSKSPRKSTDVDRKDSIGRPMSMPSGAAVHKMDLAEVVLQYKNYIAAERLKEADMDGVDGSPKRTPGKIKRYITAWKKGFHRNRAERLEEDELARDYEEIFKAIKAEEDYTDLKGKGKLWIGKDYVNFIFKDVNDVQVPFSDFIDRTTNWRLPWHDISSVVYGSAARDVARHFIQRWNATKLEKLKDDNNFPLLLPKSYENVAVPPVFRRISQRCSVQVLRSSCQWSTGENSVDSSIHQAYIDLITNAQHYVYIENQFFISMIQSQDVTNGICKALCDRIVRAYQNGEKFRLYVLLPLLPGFEGQIGAATGSALQAVLHWTYRSISTGSSSLLVTLQAKIGDVTPYVSFCGLRTHEELSGEFITELIYIHSKLIIVDDCKCLIGSANINDRSQLGTRDSEVAIYVKDEMFEDSMMDGKPFRRGKFCGSLRMRLFREHLGLLPVTECDEVTPLRRNNLPHIDVSDIVSDDFFHGVWGKISCDNTEIYDKVFHCIPTDKVKYLEECRLYEAEKGLRKDPDNRHLIEEMLKSVQGYLVSFPTKFLCNSNLAPSYMTKEGLAPMALWT